MHAFAQSESNGLLTSESALNNLRGQVLQGLKYSKGWNSNHDPLYHGIACHIIHWKIEISI